MRIKVITAFLFVATSVLAGQRAIAQSTFGSIVGTVQDQTGAVIGQTSVTVRNVDENISQTQESNGSGEFLFLNLKPGTYEISSSRNGFSRIQVSDIHLEARQERRVILQLSIEKVRQEVEVKAGVATINTENATIADSKDGQQVAELPVNYRGATTSPLAALVAVPGVQQDSSGRLSIGGGLPSTIDFSLDGISTANIRVTGPNQNMYPSSELISEFRVSAVDNNAEFAQVGDLTVTTKSGGNTFHGSTFEYLQNRVLDAITYGAPSKPDKVYNTFGASLGGPVLIPHLFDGHNRTFFFFDYEGNTLRGTSFQQDYVPTLSERAGNGSAIAGGSVSQINSVASQVLAYYPSPNTTVQTSNGPDDHYYNVNRPTPSTTNGVDVRIDQVINSKQQVFGRYSWKTVSSTAWSGISSAAEGTLLPASAINQPNNTFLVAHSYVIKPNLLNEFRFGASLWKSIEVFPLNGVAVDTALGLTGLDLTQQPQAGAFPVFNFSAGTGFSPIGRQKDGPTESSTYQYTDNISWIKGRHTLKFGVDLRKLGYRDVEHFAPADDFGTFNFYGEFTGNSFQDFLSGLPNDDEVAVTGPDLDSRALHVGIYGQDEFHLTPKITASYGLRWEFHPPFIEENGNLANFDPKTDDMIIPDGGLAPATEVLESINDCNVPSYLNPAITQCTSLVKASQVGLGPGLRAAYYKNFDPRLGIAYRPFGDSKTVVRAGIGIFTAVNLGPQSFMMSGNATSSFIDYPNYTAPGVAPLFVLPQATAPLSGGANPLEGSIGTADFEFGLDMHLRDAESAQWNFTLERELHNTFTLRASYIGMNTYRLMNVVDLNQVHPGSTPYNPASRPYQNWGQLFILQNNAGANYQSLQVQADHPYSHGLYLQGTYTLAKNLTNAEGTGPTGFPGRLGGQFTDRFDPRADRGNDFGTRRHRVLLTGIYQLPVGRGQSFLTGAHGLTQAILGGWRLSTVTLLETGPFQTPTSAPTCSFQSSSGSAIDDYCGATHDDSNGKPIIGVQYDPLNINLYNSVETTNLTGGTPPMRPDRIGNGNISNHNPGHWFDANAFQAIPQNAGRDGTASVGILEGPGTIAVAAGMAKEFVLAERVKIRFESTFTNILNHPNFAEPDSVWGTPLFGVTTSVQTAENAGNRTGQVALRLEF